MWKTVKLGDVCELATGGTPSRKKKEYFENGNIKWLVSGDINQREIYDCEGRITDEGLANSNAKYLPENSVLIALNGQGKTRGTVALLRTKATCNQSLVSINPKTGVALDTKFLFYVLDGMYGKIRTMTGDSGNDRRGLNMPLIRSIEIPLPPLAEQQRIVAKLDAGFAEIDRAVEIENEMEAEAKTLERSVIENVFSSPYRLEKVGELGDVKSGGTPNSKEASYWSGDIPWYSSGELNNLFTSKSEKFITSAGLNNSNAKLFPKGTLLVGMYDTAAMKMSILQQEATFNQAIVGIPPNDFASTEYLFYALNFLKPQILLERRGVRQQNLSLAKIKNIDVPLPNPSVQKEIVKKLKAFSAEQASYRSVIEEKRERFHLLKSAILAQELQPPQSDAA